MGIEVEMNKRLRREVGPTGAAVWHLPNSSLIIFWPGPGARLRIGYNVQGEHLSSIDHPSASDEYRTLKTADAAVKRFLKSSRDPGEQLRLPFHKGRRDFIVERHAFGLIFYPNTSRAKAWTKKHIRPEPWEKKQFPGGFTAEHRYARDIVDALDQEGFIMVTP